MATYLPPNRGTSRRSVGNLDGTSAGVGGTDTARIQAGTGDFFGVTGSVKDNSYVSAKSDGSLDIKMQNVGQGSGVFARKERDGQTFSFRRLAAGSGMTISEVGDSIYLTATGGVENFVNLKDVPNSFTGQDGNILVVDEANSRLVFKPAPGGSFLSLSDTPSSFTGHNGEYLRVNANTGKIEFASISLGTQPARITFAPIPPDGALQGDGWWDTDDGSFYLYYTDGDSGQWVESGSSEPALIPQSQYAYDYGAYFDGQPGPSDVVYRWRAPRAHTLAANFDGCLFTCGTNPTANATFQVFINGQSVGSWIISPSGAATMVSNTQGSIDVPANQEIKIVAPTAADATLADLVISFKGERY